MKEKREGRKVRGDDGWLAGSWLGVFGKEWSAWRHTWACLPCLVQGDA